MILLCALSALLAMFLGCSSERVAQARVTARGIAPQALASADLVSVQGSYGNDCTDRTGAWSLPVATPSPLDPPRLSVLVHDLGCVLTLTALRTTGGVLTATPEIVLSTSYAAGPSAFAMPVAFYAKARLSAADFPSDFELTLLYSSDPKLNDAHHYAVAIPPKVIDETPEPSSTGRSINTRPTAKFDTAMDATTLTNLTFTLRQGMTPVAGTVTFDVPTNTATFKPTEALLLNSSYTATITVGARDMGNTPLASSHVWSFTTAMFSQASVNLGTASTYAVLSNAEATNTGPTAITGDIGSNTSLTGFPPGSYSGTAHVADAAAAQAVSDLTSAYGDAAGRMLNPIALMGNIGGTTRLPGLYRAASTLEVSVGDLTLDANGDVDAVFIFQIGTTLTMGSDRKVFLAGGARAANIFWQVGSSATLGTGSVLFGTIIADQAITLTTNAVVYGRALARDAAVTMDTNMVVRPTL